jgi:hypothetical protein
MLMMVPDISFLASMSSVKLPRYRASKNEMILVKRSQTLCAEVRPAESDKYVSNGRTTKMVPTTELRSNGAGLVRPVTVNGSPNGAVNGLTKAPINGSPKTVVNGSTKVVINGSTKAVLLSILDYFCGTELSLSSKGRMILGLRKIFWFISYTLPQCHAL